MRPSKPACLSSWAMGTNKDEKVYGEKNIFLYLAKAGQKSIVLAPMSPTNQPRKVFFHFYFLSPHSPQF